MESLGVFFASIASAIFGFSIWKILEKVGVLKGKGQDLVDQSTNRALGATTLGLDTLERVIDSLETRISKQEIDYNEDIARMKERYQEDTRLLREEISTLRTILEARQTRLSLFRGILVEHNLLPDGM